MARYMLIMRGTDESNAAMMASIEEGIARTRLFIEEMMKAGVLLGAEGLDDPAQGVVVDFSGEVPVVTDGPYDETKELFGGFFLLDVASKAEAGAPGAGLRVGVREAEVGVLHGDRPRLGGAVAPLDGVAPRPVLPASVVRPPAEGHAAARLDGGRHGQVPARYGRAGA